ncbi:MAG: S-layer homology domain-containing protein [bacterium]
MKKWIAALLMTVLVLGAMSMGAPVGDARVLQAWPTFQYNSQHTGLSPLRGPKTEPALKWMYDFGKPVLASPVIGSIGSAETLFVAADKLYAIQAAPEPFVKWAFSVSADTTFDYAPTIGPDGTIYAPANTPEHHALHAINPDGTRKWSFPTGSLIHASPVMGVQNDPSIYLAAGKKLWAINPDGTVKWSETFAENIYSTPAISEDGRILYLTTRSVIYALDLSANRATKWKLDLGALIDYCSPAVDSEGWVWVGTEDGTLWNLRSDTAFDKTQLNPGVSVFSAIAFGPDGGIYWADDEGWLYGGPRTGRKWRSRLATGSYPTVTSPAVGQDGTIYVGSSDKKVFALNPASDILWTYPLQGSVSRGSPVIGMDATLYIVDKTGKLYALATPSPSPSPSPTATLGPPPSSPSPTIIPSLSFPDVPPDYWAYDEIMSLVGAGVVVGYPDGTFKPEFPVTRAEFCKMTLLALGLAPESPASPSFPDVAPGEWYYGYVEGAVKHNLVKGYPDGSFRPQGNITLAEVLTVIVRTQQWELVSPPGPPPYILVLEPDNVVRNLSSADWFYSSVGAAATHGLLLFPDDSQIASPGAGSGEYELRFNSPASRAQTAVFLHRIMA